MGYNATWPPASLAGVILPTSGTGRYERLAAIGIEEFIASL
jgi:hypothetical protein